MFDLEKSIADWRRTMLAVGIKAPVPLDELELHLREEIERQLKSGLGAQPAFEFALQQLGHPRAVRDEFKKAGEATAMRAWKQKQSLVLAGTGLISLYVCVAVLFRLGGFSEAATGRQISGLAAMAAFHLFIWSALLIWRILPVIAAPRIREAVSISGSVLLILWWVLFTRVVLPHQNFTMSQLMVALLWGFFPPMGIWIGLFWGLDIAARKKPSAAGA